MEKDKSGTDLLHISFNQDYGCFACGTDTGFRVFNCDPLRETFCRGFNNGGIGIVEMLFRCNILAIVGGGVAPKYPPNKVMIWDDHAGRCIGELTFRSQVRAVRLRRDRIVVALEHKVLVYNFADLKLVHQIETLANVKGLIAISSAQDSTVLACPGLHTGQVRLELYDRRQTKFISAHENALSCLTLSMDGKRLATTSEKGTLIRIWNTTDCTKLQELRRGMEPAVVYSLAMSQQCDWLVVSSDKGTVHIFALGPKVASNAPEYLPENTESEPVEGESPAAIAAARQNPTSIFSMVKGLVPLPRYFASEWSFAQFKLPEDNYAIAGFLNMQPNTVIIVTQSGSYYKIIFDPARGGTCNQQTYCKFNELDDSTP